MNQIELCRKLTAIDSSASHGTRDIAVAIGELATTWGLHFDMETEVYAGVEYASIMLRPLKSDSAKSSLLLTTHLDTEDPGEYASWVHTGANPFSASLDGDYLFGLGVSDAKGDLACKLLALRECASKTYAERVPMFVGTFGLSSGIGALRLIRKKKLPTKGAIALVSGPTQMQMANTGAGYARVEVSIPFSERERRHRNDHSAAENSISQSKIFTRPTNKEISFELYDNPIMKLIEYLKQMPAGIALISADGGSSSSVEPDSAYLEFDIQAIEGEGVTQKLVRMGEALVRLSAELKSFMGEDNRRAFSALTLGTLRTYPDDIKLSGVCRLSPVRDRDIYEVWLEKLHQDCKNIGAQFHVLDFKPPFANSSTGELVDDIRDEIQQAGFRHDFGSALGCTDANILSRFGVESYVFGPGEYAEIPQPAHERVKVKDLQGALDIYVGVIRRICK